MGDQDAPYQPELTPWRHVWRYALVLFMAAGIFAVGAEPRFGTVLGWGVVDVSLGLITLVISWYRRRWPLATGIVTNALTVVSGTAAGPSTLVAVSVASRRKLREIIPLGIVMMLAGAIYNFLYPGPSSADNWFVTLSLLPITAAVLAFGMYIGSRRELVWTLQQRAIRAEEEQELRSDQARVTERQRIAREMHDVLAHEISQISMYAGALAFRTDLDADGMRDVAGTIQTKANSALTSLRDVLGVLRDDSGELTNRPQPTLSDIPQLVEEARLAGMRIEYDEQVAPLPVPDAAGRTLYRIVQEGLTNAHKHAQGAQVNIQVIGDPETGLGIELENPLGFGRSSAPTSGLGLVGLTERAHLRGGTLEYRKDGSTFVLRGWIPWQP